MDKLGANKHKKRQFFEYNQVVVQPTDINLNSLPLSVEDIEQSYNPPNNSVKDTPKLGIHKRKLMNFTHKSGTSIDQSRSLHLSRI